jgi:hypothetical protein
MSPPFLNDDVVPFYNYQGRAVGYFYDFEWLYLYDGTPVAWLHDEENVYAFNGKYLGWFQDGWIRDRQGQATFFVDGASGGPVKPARHARPARSARRARPARAARQARPARPARKVSWSSLGDEAFFR